MINNELNDIKKLVDECITNHKQEFIANLIYTLQKNYKDLAVLSTDGNYNDSWSHTRVMDYITYEA